MMKRDPVAIFGAGGLGLDIGIELIACADQVVFLDDCIGVKAKVDKIGSLLVGGSEKLEDPRFLRRHDLIIAVGDNTIRRKLAVIAESNGAKLAPFIYPDASVGNNIEIANGIMVLRGASVSNRVSIGKGAIVGSRVTIAHDCVIGEFANICDGAVLGGRVRIGPGAFIGLGAIIKSGVVIGDNAVVGCGANVIRDVPVGVTVVGNPARILDRKASNVQQPDHPDSPPAFPHNGGGIVIPIGSGTR